MPLGRRQCSSVCLCSQEAVATRQWVCCRWFTVRGRQPLQQDSGRAFFSSLYGEGSRCNKTVGVLSLVHCMGKAAVATRQWWCCRWFTVRGRQLLQQDIGRAFFSSLYGEGSRCNKTVGVLSLVHCMGKAAVATRQWWCCRWFTVRGRQLLQQDIGRAFFSSLYGEGSHCNKTVGVLSLVHCMGKAAIATRQWACFL